VAYDEELADRLREALAGETVTEKRMFGGLAFLINGHIAVSASGRGGLLLRVDPAESEALIADPAAERAVMGGRVMDGWLRIATSGLDDDRQFAHWVRLGVAAARTLPPTH
jgi:TfoX/Sxy family transcriptional regulator of competence genes